MSCVSNAPSLVVPVAQAEPPASSGIVIRFQDAFFYCYVDVAAGLWAYHGINDVQSYCATGSAEYLDPLDIQWVISASAPDVVEVMEQGNDEESAIAICHASIVDGKSLAQAMKEFYLAEIKAVTKKEEDGESPGQSLPCGRRSRKPVHLASAGQGDGRPSRSPLDGRGLGCAARGFPGQPIPGAEQRGGDLQVAKDV